MTDAPSTSATAGINPWGLAVAFVGFMLIAVAVAQLAKGVNGWISGLSGAVGHLIPHIDLPDLPAIGIGGHNIVDLPNLPTIGLGSFDTTTQHPTAATVIALSQPAGTHPIGAVA